MKYYIPDFQHLISNDLKMIPRWVCHRSGEPIVPFAGTVTEAALEERASLVDPDSWGAYDAVWDCFERSEREFRSMSSMTALRLRSRYPGRLLDGIGFVLIPGDDVVCFDLDACRNPETGEAEPWAAELLSQLDSYTELSVSGTGFHVFCRAEGHFADARLEEPRVRIYSQEHFVRVTGVRVDGFGASVVDRSAEVHRLLDGLGANEGLDGGDYTGLSFPSTVEDRELEELLGAVQANGVLERWVMVGLVLHNEFSGGSEGAEVWRRWTVEQGDPELDEQNTGQAWEGFEPPPWMNVGVLDFLDGGAPPNTTLFGEDFESLWGTWWSRYCDQSGFLAMPRTGKTTVRVDHSESSQPVKSGPVISLTELIRFGGEPSTVLVEPNLLLTGDLVNVVLEDLRRELPYLMKWVVSMALGHDWYGWMTPRPLTCLIVARSLRASELRAAVEGLELESSALVALEKRLLVAPRWTHHVSFSDLQPELARLREVDLIVIEYTGEDGGGLDDVMAFRRSVRPDAALLLVSESEVSLSLVPDAQFRVVRKKEEIIAECARRDGVSATAICPI